MNNRLRNIQDLPDQAHEIIIKGAGFLDHHVDAVRALMGLTPAGFFALLQIVFMRNLINLLKEQNISESEIIEWVDGVNLSIKQTVIDNLIQKGK